MKEYDKNKESSYLQYWDVNISYEWAISQKFPVNIFEWIEDTSQFNKVFIKNYNKKRQRIFSQSWFSFNKPKKLHELHNDLPFDQKEWKLRKSKR